MDEKLKALANDIMEQCQKQGLTFSEVRTVMGWVSIKADEGQKRAMEKAGDYQFTAILL